MIYRLFIRPILFLFDAETVHNIVLKFISKARFLYPFLKSIYSSKHNSEVNVNGLRFKNPLGLAAGFDKNGIAIEFWEALGFSHAEIGTVTPLPQKGNDKPRIFRLKKDEAIINRLGFNSKGAEEVKKNILDAKKNVSGGFVIGVNIGKNKNTPIKDAVLDYKICFESLYDAADYFTINVSSPNTEGLRMLQEEEYLDNLLKDIQNLNKEISGSKSSALKCVFLKISPDVNDSLLESVFKLSVRNNITGIIATNTTVERMKLKTNISQLGGLSGKPLKSLSDTVLKNLHRLNSNNALKLVGVGGVFDHKDYEDKIISGANLVQIYTGFIYEGPGIIKNILKEN